MKKKLIAAVAAIGFALPVAVVAAQPAHASGITITQNTRTVKSVTKNGVTTTTICVKKVVNGVVVENGCTTTVTTH